MQFGKQNNWSSWWYSPPVLIVLVVLFVLLAISVWERYTVEREMAARKEEAMVELHQLEARERELKERVTYLEGERGVEEEIRKNFDVAMPGEQVVILTGEPKKLDVELAAPLVPNRWYHFWR